MGQAKSQPGPAVPARNDTTAGKARTLPSSPERTPTFPTYPREGPSFDPPFVIQAPEANFSQGRQRHCHQRMDYV